MCLSTVKNQPLSQLATIVFTATLCTLTGCGADTGHLETAPVSGTVQFDGKPVTGGSLVFTPAGGGPNPGKQGIATIGSDGTYSLSTYGDNDGAIVGSHTVEYHAPIPEDYYEEPESEFTGLVPSVGAADVKNETNTIDITLTKASDG